LNKKKCAIHFGLGPFLFFLWPPSLPSPGLAHVLSLSSRQGPPDRTPLLTCSAPPNTACLRREHATVDRGPNMVRTSMGYPHPPHPPLSRGTPRRPLLCLPVTASTPSDPLSPLVQVLPPERAVMPVMKLDRRRLPSLHELPPQALWT
jgi:hypothetical protein